jgi:acyl carrier protein
MNTRQQILETIRGQISEVDISEETELADLGIASLHLISLIIGLQQEYGFSIEALADSGLPKTVGEIVTLVANSTSVSYSNRDAPAGD